ncbi:MAG: hypothetical protein ACI89J_000985 [Hyphomicrobiaceae bacterium]|jgi:hypothetical protein
MRTQLFKALRGCCWVAMAAVSMVLGACTHQPFDTALEHYSTVEVPEPKGATLHVCSAYGCRTQSKVKFSAAQLDEIRQVMKKTAQDDSPGEERRAMAYAIGWLERHVGERIGTKHDRAGMDFLASGDPQQQDCLDEATNTTSYLTLLASHGMLKHHTVAAPFAKENYLRGISGWTHWTAVLRETSNGQKWAVDSWIQKNGENPAVVEAEKWYLTGLEDLPGATI